MSPAPDLLILAPPDLTLSRQLAARMVELGVFFPFAMPGYRLPTELPADTAHFKGIVLPAEQAARWDARLGEFERRGGFVMRMGGSDWQNESFIERIAVRCALKLQNPAMRAWMESLPDRDVLGAALGWCETFVQDQWTDVLRYQIECQVTAHALTGEATRLEKARALVDRALAIQPASAASCDHLACVLAILQFAQTTGRRELIALGRRVTDEFIRLAPKHRGIWSNLVRRDERGMARSEIAFQACPACARLARLTGESEYADLAAGQILLLDKELESSGLWVLGVGEGGRTPCLWGRGAVFGLRGVVDTLEEMGESHPSSSALLEIVRRMAKALRRFQGPDGTWCQVLDEPDTGMECSTTAWATAGLAKALRLGWLAAGFEECVEKGWRATKRHAWDGMPVNTCGGVTASMDPSYYRHRHFFRPSPFGHFPALAAIEFLRFKLASRPKRTA